MIFSATVRLIKLMYVDVETGKCPAALLEESMQFLLRSLVQDKQLYMHPYIAAPK
jgi:hypothetical protein